MKLRIYLDTSVISALGDARAPDRQALTREFFDRITDFEASTSELTRIEIGSTHDAKRRKEMLGLLERLIVVAIPPDAQALADRYLLAGIFPRSVPEDALHVAIAVLTRQDAIASWNFKHLVNQRRRAEILALNLSLGLPAIAILPPPEF